MSKEPEEKADYSIRIDQCCSFKPSMDNTQGYKKADGQEVKESGNGGKEMMEIYYIEDDKNIANIVKEYLEQKAFIVTVFSTLGEARCALDQRVPGLVLMDWNMPDGKGIMIRRI